MAQNIDYLSPTNLTPCAGNARRHSKAQIRQIAESITTFGFTAPVLIDEADMILAGHGRVLAALSLEMTQVPCVRLAHLSPVQKRAYVLADNKLALNASWDEDLLASELAELLADPSLDFDLGVIGFSIPEVDMMIEGLAPEEPGDPADDALPETAPPRCAPGDIWQLGGEHRLICGDALDPAVVAQLMAGQQARMVFTDPPYNVPIEGHVGNSGKTRHREFAMAAGEMSRGEFEQFLTRALRNHHDHASMAQYIISAWTGGTWARCWRLAMPFTVRSRT